jgi:hypothetical protein
MLAAFLDLFAPSLKYVLRVASRSLAAPYCIGGRGQPQAGLRLACAAEASSEARRVQPPQLLEALALPLQGLCLSQGGSVGGVSCRRAFAVTMKSLSHGVMGVGADTCRERMPLRRYERRNRQ